MRGRPRPRKLSRRARPVSYQLSALSGARAERSRSPSAVEGQLSAVGHTCTPWHRPPPFVPRSPAARRYETAGQVCAGAQRRPFTAPVHPVRAGRPGPPGRDGRNGCAPLAGARTAPVQSLHRPGVLPGGRTGRKRQLSARSLSDRGATRRESEGRQSHTLGVRLPPYRTLRGRSLPLRSASGTTVRELAMTDWRLRF